MTTLQQYKTTTLQHYKTTTPIKYNTTNLQHYNTTTLQHCSTTIMITSAHLFNQKFILQFFTVFSLTLINTDCCNTFPLVRNISTTHCCQLSTGEVWLTPASPSNRSPPLLWSLILCFGLWHFMANKGRE